MKEVAGAAADYGAGIRIVERSVRLIEMPTGAGATAVPTEAELISQFEAQVALNGSPRMSHCEGGASAVSKHA